MSPFALAGTPPFEMLVGPLTFGMLVGAVIFDMFGTFVLGTLAVGTLTFVGTFTLGTLPVGTLTFGMLVGTLTLGTHIDAASARAIRPWTNGQVERMNRTLKEATVRRYHYDSHHQLRQHMQIFLDAYNFAKRLKTLNGLTPFESVCKAWTKEPNRFKYDPVQLTSGLHS